VLVVLAWATAAVLATTALVAWWVLRQGVRPLAALAATADAVARGELSQRVADTDTRTEAGRLGRAFNGMLARIEEAFAQRAATEARLRRFAADASHELRTPLTSIRGYADLYRQGALADDVALDGAMGRIEAEAARMGGLVDDLLLLARLDQDRPLERTPLRLDELVADAVRDARAVEPDRPITLSADPATVVGDEARLRQVIGNLLANARVHTPAGTPVEVAVGAQDGWAVVEVADEGPGLDPEQAGRVFERFYRADPARTRASGGTGLGLAIVASVARAHGGAAEVDSAPGKGARFRLRLPV
jgi:signal transduction histidine kinase